jgi:peptide/nickel transport system permease protein
MARYLARQGALLVVLLLVGSFVIFLIVDLAPGDPLAALLGTQTPDPERIAQLTAQYHLDKPLPVRYWLWLTSALQGDFGQSIVFQTDVSALLARALPISVTLILMAEALIIVLGVTAAIIAARFRGAPDALVALGSSLFVSVPVFVVAVALSILFGRILGWFPTVGPGDGAIDRVYHLILPAIAIALGASALLARVGRSALRDELESPHVTTEVARGVPSTRVFRRHVLRNGMPPMLAVIALQVPALIAGTVVVEQAFNLGGVGSLLLSGVTSGDFAVVQAIALLILFVTVTLGIVVDIAYGILDPRVKVGGP